MSCLSSFASKSGVMSPQLLGYGSAAYVIRSTVTASVRRLKGAEVGSAPSKSATGNDEMLTRRLGTLRMDHTGQSTGPTTQLHHVFRVLLSRLTSSHVICHVMRCVTICCHIS